MLGNYLTIAFRNLRREKLYSCINVLGLALGMAVSLLIGLWVNEERSFNGFFAHLSQLYYVRASDGTHTSTVTPGPLADALKRDIAGIEKAVKITSWTSNYLLEANGKSGKAEGIYASEDFFAVFAYPVLAGDPTRALSSPNDIIITRKVAQAYFGTTQAVGQRIRLNESKQYQVGAVLENVPTNSSLQFDWVVNFAEQEEEWMQDWGSSAFLTYVKLHPSVTGTQAQAAIRPLYQKYAPGKHMLPLLQPLQEVYLYDEYEGDKAVGGRIQYVKFFSLVAGLILLIACINFMNLSTARSAYRAREVGVRKVVGAQRASLIGQFLSEALLTSLLAGLLAVGMAKVALPVLNEVFGKQLTLSLINPWLWGVMGLGVVLTGLVAGSYPAYYLASLQPIQILKGKRSASPNSAFLRKTLVVFQFTLATFFLITMLVIGRQLHYVRTKHLGLNRAHLLYVPVEGALRTRMEAFSQALQASPAIGAVTTTGELPIRISSSTTGSLLWRGKDPALKETVAMLRAGEHFAQALQVKLLAGRDFASPADTTNFLVNESAAKLMGFPHPVGEQITFQGRQGRIIGLLKDFHLASLHTPIQPLVVAYYPKWTNYFLIRTYPRQTQQAIAYLAKATKAFNPSYPFAFHFLDEDYNKLYRSEMQVGTLVNYAGGLAILISCLGLFGLASFTAQKRTPEMGIRKVLGASVGNLLALLAQDFLRLVALAFLLAAPLAAYFMQQWLANFQYRTPLSGWVFVLAGSVVGLIALLTVSAQSIKAALANPVDSLRSE